MITTKNNKAMKANIFTTALIAMITLFSSTAFAADFDFEEEAYIDDIPFNTEEIYLDSFMEEESYINDIPFNTALIASNAKLEKYYPYSIKMEEEAYVDDIPFNTQTVVALVNYKKALEVDFSFNDEDYVDDIPFDTEDVALNSARPSFSGSFLLVDFVSFIF